MAHGLGPLALLNTQRHGLQLNALRGGPLDKKGVGSGILDPRGAIDPLQLERLGQFASEKISPNGGTELGLSLAELSVYMDANFARAATRSRYVDRTLMLGEWPVLLKVMGQQGSGGRYLGLQDVIDLFKKRSLPARMAQRVQAAPR